MPGTYTHITVARLLTEGTTLRSLSNEVRRALMEYAEFCHLGAISPDYPYLRIIGEGKKEAEIWANCMHHKYGTLTKGNILHIGINYLKRLTGDIQSKCLSWFLGYASHITADVTCHPVTNLLVGDYEADNQVAHRVSEMHQDVYIFKTRVDGDVRKSEHIKNVIGSCTDTNDRNKVDSDVEKIWSFMLSKAFPDIYSKYSLDINSWHNAVQFFLDDIAEELSFIPSRHVREYFEESGVAYPRFSEIDRNKYIDQLKTPKGTKTYDQIFDKAKRNVMKVWKLISDGIFLTDDAYKEKIKIWNLDTGQEVQTPKVMWENVLS